MGLVAAPRHVHNPDDEEDRNPDDGKRLVSCLHEICRDGEEDKSE